MLDVRIEKILQFEIIFPAPSVQRTNYVMSIRDLTLKVVPNSMIVVGWVANLPSL